MCSGPQFSCYLPANLTTTSSVPAVLLTCPWPCGCSGVVRFNPLDSKHSAFGFVFLCLSLTSFFPPQGPKSIRLRLLPVTLPSRRSTLCLQLQRPPDQADLAHTWAVQPRRRYHLAARSHPQWREPHARGEPRRGHLRQPHTHEERVRR